MRPLLSVILALMLLAATYVGTTLMADAAKNYRKRAQERTDADTTLRDIIRRVQGETAFIPARADDLAREIGVYTERGELAVDADEKLEAYLRSTGKSQTSSPQIQVPEEQGEKAH